MPYRSAIAFLLVITAAQAEPSPVRDLSLADVQLQLDDLRISVNGSVLDASTRVGGSISGAALWFYLPERGRFVMSLLPNPKLGFRRAGEVTNALLSFTDGNDRYDIKSTSRIAPASGRFNLYVLRDPEWRPTEVNRTRRSLSEQPIAQNG
jgi:hypothetical protein